MKDKKNLLNIICLCVSLLLAIILLTDWPSLLSLNNDKKNISAVTTLDVNDLSREFLIHQYDTGVKEIQARISQEHYLFALKFSLVGSIFALLFASFIKSKNTCQKCDKMLGNSTCDIIFCSPIAAGICWAAVIVSAIVDTRILYNVSFITELGNWIKTTVEPALLTNNAWGWENFLSNRHFLKSKPYVFLRLNSNILTLVLFIPIYLIFFQKKTTNIGQRNWQYIQAVSFFSSVVAFIIFGIAGLHYCYKQLVCIIFDVIFVAIGIAITFGRWKLLKKIGDN